MIFNSLSKKYARTAVAMAVLLALGACSDDDDDDNGDDPIDVGAEVLPLSVELDAAQELPVPAGVPEEATGSATVSVDDDGAVTALLGVSGLSGTATMAHIHRGFAGQTGPILIPLATEDGGTTWTVADDAPALTDDQIGAFNRGELYFNVHTELNPSGEIRGQIDSGLATSFTVRLENVSTAETLIVASDTTTQPVPMSPGVFIIHRNEEDSPLLQERDAANAGLEGVAEDGNTEFFAEAVPGSVVFNTPVDADGPGPIVPGGAYEFTFQAVEGDKLDFALMFIPSNDWFFSFVDEENSNSLDLFEDGQPVTGTVATTDFAIWDAGTEADEEPGTGPNQVQRQDGALNVGPVDADTSVDTLETRGQSVSLNGEVLEVTITAQ